jgi:hypothetical protein
MAFDESEGTWDSDSQPWYQQYGEHGMYNISRTESDEPLDPPPPAPATIPITVTLVSSPPNRRKEVRRAQRRMRKFIRGIREILAVFDGKAAPSQILLTMCRQFGIEAERAFLFAFLEKIVGVRPTRSAIIGRRKKDMVWAMDEVNRGALTEAFQNPAVRLDVLNLLRNFFSCASAEGFERTGTYEIKFEL